MTARYEIRIGNHPNGKFGVWDHHLSVWQVSKPTRSAAEAWITQRLTEDAQPQQPSTLKVRMPLRD